MKALSIGWILFIIALLSIPGESIPNHTLFTFDKVGHFGVFFIGALLWIRTWPDRAARIFVVSVAFSVGTELYQGYMPFLGRSADPYDVVADVIGLALGLGLALWLRQRMRVPAAQPG